MKTQLDDIPTHQPLPHSPLFTRTEAAHYIGVKPQTLAVWACHQRYPLPMIKVGRLVKYRKTDLDAFLDANRQGGCDAHA